MYARVLTYSGVDDFDAAVRYIQETALPVVSSQRGYQGMTASADRAGRILGTLSLWATEADLDASDSALAKTREEARTLLAEGMKVETFELKVADMRRPPEVGCALMITWVSMDPAIVDETLAHYRSEIVPIVTAAPGFRTLRNMVNPETGAALVGVVFDDESTMRAFAEGALARRPEAEARGITFLDTSYRDIVLVAAP